MNIFDRIMCNAEYAKNSYSAHLVYGTWGAAKMAYELDAITKDEFLALNKVLVVDGLNNAAWHRRCED